MVARDFEAPADDNTNNIYELTITVTDSDGNSDFEDWTVEVTDVIEAATFTIDAIANTSIAENTGYTSVTPAITGTPIGTVSYALSGTDAGDFTIDSGTGVVSMIAQDFEAPADDNTDNIYEVTITVTDSDGNTATENWTVEVTDVIEAATFTIDAIANTSIAENTAYTSITPAITGTPIGTVSYALGGTDAGDFTIDSGTGVVSMIAQNFEAPADANTNNIYELSITVTDSDGNTASENWTVTITNIIEVVNFTIDAIPDTSIAENTTYTGVTPALSGATSGNVTYSLGGADANDFTIDTNTGVVSMVAQDFEAPADANTDNVYELSITAADSDGNAAEESWTVEVTDVIEAGYTLSTTTLTIAEDGGTGSYTIVLDVSPTNNVVINLTSNDTNEATVLPSSVTFTAANWNIPQTVTITGVNDSNLGDDTATITAAINAGASDDAFDALANQEVNVTLTDDDLDIINPNVTINQKAGTADPSTVDTFGTFTIVFDEAINPATFTAADVDTSTSTATGITIGSITEVAPNDDTTFEVQISVTANGNIIATIPAGGIEDLDGNTNTESTFTDNSVTINSPALGVDNDIEQNLFIYPTLVKDILIIQLKNNISIGKVKVDIYDTIGKLVLSSNELPNSNNILKINMSRFSSGVYNLVLTTDSNRIFQKRIVKE